MPSGYTACTWTDATTATTVDIALTAATAKTVLSVIGVANQIIRITEFGLSFDGTSATNEPVTVELCQMTEATSGTNTDQTPVQIYGETRTVQADSKKNYTAEPTVLTPVKVWLVHPQTGIEMQFPLGREPMYTEGTTFGMCLRVTSPATVNCRGYIHWEEA